MKCVAYFIGAEPISLGRSLFIICGRADFIGAQRTCAPS